MNEKFHNALKNIPQDVPPIWFMRQAGRYHSHYQNLRKKHTFEELCKNPNLAAEVACGPIRDFDYDVAILFSDILFPLELLDLDLKYNPGPTFTAFLSTNHAEKIISDDLIREKLSFQPEALKLTRAALEDNKSLVGFVGGPWTVLSYGLGLKNNKSIDMPNEATFIEKLLYDTIIPILKINIQMQLDAGAEIVYVFDTNSIQLSSNYFLDTYLEHLRIELFHNFKNKLAYFSKNEAFYNQPHSEISKLNLSGIVIPDDKPIKDRLIVTRDYFIQGNFSPKSMLKSKEEYKKDLKIFLSNTKPVTANDRSGWICSLSHGVLPKTPEENVRDFITSVRKEFVQD